jgi:hypothetical protein
VRDDPRVVASYLGTDERAINRSGAASAEAPAPADVIGAGVPAPLRAEPNPA